MSGTPKCYLYNPVPRTDLRARLSASFCLSVLLCQVDKSEAKLCGVSDNKTILSDFVLVVLSAWLLSCSGA